MEGLEMMNPERLRRALAERRLPCSSVTWLELVEYVAGIYGACIVQVLDGTRTRSACAARAHAWGALRGAGYSFGEIARQWGVDPTVVRYAVLRAEKRLGLDRRAVA